MRFKVNDYVVTHDDQLGMVFSTWPRGGSDSGCIDYCLLVPVKDGSALTESWFAEEYLRPATKCAECGGPTVDDYLCAKCRAAAVP